MSSANDSPAKPRSTASDLPLKPIYASEDVGAPPAPAGCHPFVRGPYPTMYLTRRWTMRQFAGYGTPEDTNRRFHFLLRQGQTGLSTAFDMPTLMGYDADHERARGEVGREGVSVSTIEDMDRLFDAIPMGRVTTSMTELRSTERVDELARMLSGVEITAKTRAHAKELYEQHRRVG